MKRRSSQSGVVHLPMAFATLVSLAFLFGTWSTLRQWREVAGTQLRLDRCTRSAVLELKSDWLALQKANSVIVAGRKALVLGGLAPAAATALRVALEAEVIQQDGIRAKWEWVRAAWITPGHCGNRGDQGVPLPELGGYRLPPDLIGPQPLIWEPEPESFRIQASHHPRQSVAELRKQGPSPNAGGINESSPISKESSRWIAKWVAPEK